MKVSILNDRGKIRLKYRHKEKYEYISLGLDYNEENLVIAQAKAKQIEGDIIFNRYEGKEKYEINPTPKNLWDFIRILDYYLDSKQHDNTTVKSVNILKDWCKRSPSRLLVPDKIDEWIIYLKKEIPRLDKGKGYANSTIFTPMKIMRAAIYFAHDMNKIPPPKNVAKACSLIQSKSKKEIRTYNAQEIALIIDSFRKNPRHSYYTSLVHFRFLTGCRPSEAIALTWDDIIYDDNRVYIRFNKRFSKGELKEGLKNNKPYRYFPCNNQLQLLINSFPRLSDYLIFPAVNGGYINCDNLAKRHWNIVLDGLVVLGKLKFRINFYDERHCFGTLVCRQTNDLQTVANIMGNSPTVLQKHYLANDLDFNIPEL